MVKRFLTLALAIIFALPLSACSEVFVNAPPATAPSPPDLIGEWKQADTSGTYQVAHISKFSTEVYQITEGSTTATLYWAGSFSTPVEKDGVFSWDSKNNTDRTTGAPFASDDELKTFQYADGIISYSAEGNIVNLEQGKWGFTGTCNENGSIELSGEILSQPQEVENNADDDIPPASDTEPPASSAGETAPEPSPDYGIANDAPNNTSDSQGNNTSSGNSSGGNGDNFNTYDNPEQQRTDATYILNTNSMKFHYKSCNDVKKISPNNYSEFYGSRSEAIANGYSPCGHCNP